MEDTLEINEELCTVTPECSHDTNLIGEELQQQEDEEVSQDVSIQELTSLEVAARTPKLQLEDNPGMDIMPDIHWSEDEQIQTQSSGDTEILEEELHTEEDIQSQRQKDKEDTVTQEPVSLEAMNEAAKESLRDVAVTQEPTTLESNLEMQVTQEKDTVTQEPVSLGMVDVVVEENPREVVATQEPATLEPNL